LLGGGCSDGDKNFTFTKGSYSSSNLSADKVLVIIFHTGNSYTVNFQAMGLWTGAGSLAYTVAVNTNSTDLLKTFSASQATSTTGSLFTGNATASGANPGTCGSTIPVSSWSCASTPLTFPFGKESSLITNTWNFAKGMSQIGNTITQQPVPGPLPILGAGAVFGLSRKLRQRIKQST
jgi:hypothetical protein